MFRIFIWCFEGCFLWQSFWLIHLIDFAFLDDCNLSMLLFRIHLLANPEVSFWKAKENYWSCFRLIEDILCWWNPTSFFRLLDRATYFLWRRRNPFCWQDDKHFCFCIHLPICREEAIIIQNLWLSWSGWGVLSSAFWGIFQERYRWRCF